MSLRFEVGYGGFDNTGVQGVQLLPDARGKKCVSIGQQMNLCTNSRRQRMAPGRAIYGGSPFGLAPPTEKAGLALKEPWLLPKRRDGRLYRRCAVTSRETV